MPQPQQVGTIRDSLFIRLVVHLCSVTVTVELNARGINRVAKFYTLHRNKS